MQVFARCALAVAFACVALPASAQDIYMGTLEVRDDQLVLRRCDVGGTVYALHDADGDTPVARHLADAMHRDGIWTASVIGTYEERGDGHALAVIALDDVQAGTSCHLTDWLEDAGG